MLPVEAFTDRAMLDEVTARVRQMFAESRITVGAGTPPPPAPPHAPAAAVLQAQAAVASGPPEQNYLAAAFTSVLRIASIAPDADFFDLGVTSLNLIEIAELLHEQHGIDVPVEVFLDHTTLRSLAQYLQGMLPAAGTRTGDAVLQLRNMFDPAGCRLRPVRQKLPLSRYLLPRRNTQAAPAAAALQQSPCRCAA